MYVLMLAILLSSAYFLMARGRINHSSGWLISGAVVLASTLALFGFMSFWGERLWFAALGYDDRFWVEVFTRLGLSLAAALISGLMVAALSPLSLRQSWRSSAGIIWGFAVLFGGLWGFREWSTLLTFWWRVETAVVDPIFQKDVGYYLFVLPFMTRLVNWLIMVTLIPVLWNLAAVFMPAAPADGDLARARLPQARSPKLYLSLGLMAFLWGTRFYIATYNLMYSNWGVVYGPGWTDVYVRRPVFYGLGLLSLAIGIYCVYLFFARSLSRQRLSKRLLIPVALMGFSVITGLGVLPALFQWLYVQPNEITVETPYISHSIAFTRRAFNLDKMEERSLSLTSPLTEQMAKNNSNILDEVRLWDPRALKAVFKQFQEIRLYYEFPDIDIDRYLINGKYRQVMVAPREMETDNLPAESQTFVNRHFKYTHGYGLALAPVSDFTSDGLPNLLIKDVPPKSSYPSLHVETPSIYFGELTDDYVVVNTKEPEFDYPMGSDNVYTKYDGVGGVQLTGLWRKIVFGWKFGGTKLLVTGYTTDESRIMFHRNIHERVSMLAPFLQLDRDPYIVLAEGRLYWILDGYTTSQYYPYSERFRGTELMQVRERQAYGRGEIPGSNYKERTNLMHRVQGLLGNSASDYLHNSNYIRNSVKAVVDAKNGSVSLYVFDPDDPIVQVWSRIFPDLLKSSSEMPESLRSHIRYPEDFLLAQGLVYAKYHMQDPVVFYNQEDLWVRATEKYYQYIVPVDPYYVLWNPTMDPGGSSEFSLIMPFTPKNRQVLIGWIAGLCDGNNYGRLISYRFPKQQWVLGPQQVDTKIDQDPYLSERLTLWDQRGSRVIRGNVLAIPLGTTLLYVEPIYIQAEAAAYPELRLVVVMNADRFSYGSTFKEALAGLFTRNDSKKSGEILPVLPASVAEQAQEAFDSYIKLMSDGQFEQAGRELERLSIALQKLSGNQSRE